MENGIVHSKKHKKVESIILYNLIMDYDSDVVEHVVRKMMNKLLHDSNTKRVRI